MISPISLCVFRSVSALPATALLLLCIAQSHAQEWPSPAIKTIVLRDVEPLHGGRNLYLRSDGTGTCQVVFRRAGSPQLIEQRFSLALSHEAMHRLLTLLTERRFFAIRLTRKTGVPGEARPTICVTPASGKALSLAKWANEANPDFDAVYSALHARVEEARHGKPLQEGVYDARWTPTGFSLP